MKLHIDQLGNHLNHQLLPVYIISGDDPLQVTECCDQIRHQARQNSFSERHTFHAESNFDWNGLLEVANSLSLFAQKQILELHMPNGKPGNAGRKALLEYIEHPYENNLLLIITGRLDSATQKSKWFKELDHAGICISISSIEPNQLPQWVSKRFKTDGYSANQEVLSLISERVEGNLLAASQEIEKLKLLAKDHVIDEETVKEYVSENARYNVFQLLDSAMEGNISKCVKILGGLRGEGVKPPVVLWAIARDVRLLSHISRLKFSGLSTELAIEKSAKALGFSSFILKRRRLLLDMGLQRHSERHLRQILLYIGHVDRCVKGIEKNNPWDELLTLVMFLAGLAPISLTAVASHT